jgi:RNA polymerase sigma factor (sigma-70 family)
MARALQELVQRLGRKLASSGLAHLADAELLRQFSTHGNAAAFEVLVWRHGSMVFHVCDRVLGSRGEVDDAFQATFLALVRHARSIRSAEALAGWLYRVARRMSIRLSRQSARRVRRETIVSRPEAVIVDDIERSDWRAVLDRELERLPVRYREAFILCHLEGRAQEDAARELGCPLGTLHSRLARAKVLLRARLRAWSVAIPAVAAGTVSARLVHATVAAAVGFAEGSVVAASTSAVALSHEVGKPMALVKIKCLIAAALAVTTLGSSAVLLKQPAVIAAPKFATPAHDEPTIEDLKRENDRLRREVASLKKRLAEVDAALRDDSPSDAEILRALPRVADGGATITITRDNITITKEKILDRIDPPRQFPLVGTARLWHRHWECVVHFTETSAGTTKQRVQVIYIDKDTLLHVTSDAK